MMTRHDSRPNDDGPLSRNRTAALLRRLRALAREVRRLQISIAGSDGSEKRLAADDALAGVTGPSRDKP
jgi:hypothetical protein